MRCLCSGTNFIIQPISSYTHSCWIQVEATKQNKPGRSLYAKATDTGINPKEAAKRLKIDWDSAAEIDESAESDEPDVPPALVSRRNNS